MKARLWEVLNTPFVLWLLSSVMLSGLTFLYSAYETEHAEKRERDRRIEMLDIEIEARLRRVAQGLDDFLYWPDRLQAALSDVARPSKAEYPVHAFSEFKESTLSGLIWELHPLVDSTEMPQILTAALAAEHLDRNYLLSGCISLNQ